MKNVHLISNVCVHLREFETVSRLNTRICFFAGHAMIIASDYIREILELQLRIANFDAKATERIRAVLKDNSTVHSRFKTKFFH